LLAKEAANLKKSLSSKFKGSSKDGSGEAKVSATDPVPDSKKATSEPNV
jgi:hypothetical protein